MDVELVPFGNANVSYPRHDNKPVFHCQHGPNECYGNRAQACVIELTKNTDLAIRFVKCMFEQSDWKDTPATAKRVSPASHKAYQVIIEISITVFGIAAIGLEFGENVCRWYRGRTPSDSQLPEDIQSQSGAQLRAMDCDREAAHQRATGSGGERSAEVFV